MKQSAVRTEEVGESTTQFAVVPPPEPPTMEEQLTALRTERDALVRQLGTTLDKVTVLQDELKKVTENPLSFALAHLDSGAVLDDAGKELQELCDAVLDQQKAGTFSLTIKVAPFKGESMTFEAATKIAPPKAKRDFSVFYKGDSGLSRNDPKQRELPLN